MALLAAGSALVASLALENQPMKTMKVRVLRAFFYNGKPTKPNETIEVPVTFGAELIAGKKVERIAEPDAIPADTADPKTGPEIKKDRK